MPAPWPESIAQVAGLIRDGALQGAGFADDEFGAGVDYEPELEAWPEDRVADWLGNWTGGDLAPASRIVPIGADGTGGMVAVFLPDTGAALDRSPIVFLGSEGESQVLAADFDDLVVLLSLGYGPFDVAGYEVDAEHTPQESPVLRTYVRDHRPSRVDRTAEEVLRAARAALPDFEATVEGWVQY